MKMLKLPILYYHRVSEPPSNPDLKCIHIEPYRLDRQLRLLSFLGYRGITLDEFMDHFESGRQPRARRVAITFDDGFSDILINALPILNRYHFPATIFIPAGLIGCEIKDNHPFGLGNGTVLSVDQIQTLVGQGIDIQSHGLMHRRFTKLSPPEAMQELLESKKILERITQKPVCYLAYPYGDFGRETEDLVRKAGYRAAVSTVRGMKHYQHERYCLKRIPVHHRQNLLRFLQYLLFKSYRRPQLKLNRLRGIEK
jgi:peptidoglycan/xylan/chitin deacetylase (PgdA/CDA1 family)